MRTIITFLLLLSPVFCIENYLDVNMITEFSNKKEKTHLDINAQVVADNLFIINPRAALFFDGSMDVSLAAGMRYSFSKGAIGHHIFWDCSATKEGHFNQVGASLDFLTDNFDYRINYYHPVTKEQENISFLSIPHKWIESEVVFKHKRFHLGIGPKYDLFDKEWGSQFKVGLPFKHLSVEFYLSHDKKNSFSGCLSLCVPIYSIPRKSFVEYPISHHSRVQYSTEPLFSDCVSINTKQDKDDKEDKGYSKEPTIQENKKSTTEDKSEKVVHKKNSSWWDFLWGKSSPSSKLTADPSVKQPWDNICIIGAFDSPSSSCINNPITTTQAGNNTPIKAEPSTPKTPDSPGMPVKEYIDWIVVENPYAPESPKEHKSGT